MSVTFTATRPLVLVLVLVNLAHLNSRPNNEFLAAICDAIENKTPADSLCYV